MLEEAIANAGEGLLEAMLWPFRQRRWIWLLPLVIYLFVLEEQQHVKFGIEAIVGVGYLLLAARRPYKALCVLVVLLPFSQVGLAFLYRVHVPSQLIRGLDFWTEGIVAGLAFAAIRRIVKERPHLDLADRLAIGYVALGSAYLVAQPLLVGNAGGGTVSFYARELGWRGDVLYVAIFVICRHLGLTREEVGKLVNRALFACTAVAAIGVYEYIRPWSFNNFLVKTVNLPRYDANILHTPLTNPTVLIVFGSSHHVRIGSVLINNLIDGFYFVMGLGLALERVTRSKSSPWVLASIPILGLGVVFSQSRAAILGAAVVVIWALRSQIGRSIAHRVRLAMLVAVMGIAALPVMIYGGVFHRFESSGDNSGHTSSVVNGLHIMGSDPLGRGLATGAGAGQTAQAKGVVTYGTVFIPEDQWLEIGTQLGIVGLAVYAGTMVLIVRRVGPRRGQQPIQVLAGSSAGMQSAMLGLLAGGLFLTPFIEPVLSWSAFAMCGLAASVFDQVPRESSDTYTYAHPGASYPRPVPVAATVAGPRSRTN